MATSTTSTAVCPLCGKHSRHVHSQYFRTLRDLPSQGATVRICLRTRRFYCRGRDCLRRIFTERFPSLANAHARQTSRHLGALECIGYALGGEPGFRLAAQLGIRASGDTILRTIKRRSSMPSHVRVLGVDDWAWRRGHRYGTVLVDLERHRPVDLLPDRESATLARWLRDHPEVEIISRDRAGAYAQGARKGAPGAVQIADRFHILCNLTQAIRSMLDRMATTLHKLELPAAIALPCAANAPAKNGDLLTESADPIVIAASDSNLANERQQQFQERQQQRQARFEAVKAARGRGLTHRAIAEEFGLNIQAVRRLLKVKQLAPPAPRRHRTRLEPFREYLQRRWSEGCHNASQLLRELREQGYAGHRSRVKEFLHPWRSHPPNPSLRRPKLPAMRQVAFWLTKPALQRNALEEQWVKALAERDSRIATVAHFAQEFRNLFRDHDASALPAWLNRAEQSGIPELRGFASGIRRDQIAVIAALQHRWSNGQVEGQVHRLKLLKRQMYGRSGFLLLRKRVLPFVDNAPESAPRAP
ncbi:MAG TPA: ISL3 family transposase [Candidatus Angelobacter sp.]|nr:ISL3 family transposase [Candidatus Udaeobacter sp.]